VALYHNWETVECATTKCPSQRSLHAPR